ncbi:MAG: NAD(+) synthase [Bacteroidales bacterium]|nr:NAD(+) synthase [Bacteroidales bacterium]
MKDYGFIRVAAAVPVVKLADVKANTEEIIRLMEQAHEDGVSILVFPELCVTGYSCGDLFGQQLLIDAAENAVSEIRRASRAKAVTVIVGAPVRFKDRLYNCAVVIRDGVIRGLVPKIYLPTYNEFYESRWFASGEDFLSPVNRADGAFLNNAKDHFRDGFDGVMTYAGSHVNINPNQIFTVGRTSFAVEVCEDLWTPVPPSSYHALEGAELIFNLSASNEVLSKHMYRRSLVSNQSARTVSGYVYCSCGFGESTQDVVYAGAAMIVENGTILARNERFKTESSLIEADVDVEKLKVLRQKQSTFRGIAPDGTRSSQYSAYYQHTEVGLPAPTDFDSRLLRKVDPRPFVPVGDAAELEHRSREITSIQVMGLASRLSHIHAKTAVIGISGGLDSTLALLVTAMAFDKLGLDRKGIIGVTMPGFGTTNRTHDNAVDLMEALGVTSREIPIGAAVNQHFKDIAHNPEVKDVTYENSQARERTQILMDLANQEGGIVVGTGDLSEMALGWATYNGDHMSMYAVNGSIPKTLVKYLVEWTANNRFQDCKGRGRSAHDILFDIIDTPISPELLPADEKGNIAQVTEDLVGPYELHDFFLYNFFRFGYSPEKILFLAKKAFEGGEYDEPTIEKWLRTFVRRFFNQQFKRSCMPDSPKVGSVTLSPRGDWRMPSDAFSSLFLSDLD